MELLIDPEFKKWIMPLRQDEYEGLKENIRVHGCTQPLDIWNNIIVDGHNRYKICKELNIDFQVHDVEFTDREEVKNYMIRNQLARRNVTPGQRDYLMGKLYSEQKNKHGTNQYTSPTNWNPLNVESSKSEQIGEQFKVTHATVERAEKFADAVDALAANCGHDIRDKILSGDVHVTKTDVIRLSNLPRHDQQKAVTSIRKGMKGKHAIDRLWSQAEAHSEEKMTPDTISIPCGNPRCEREVHITRSQYKEFVGVYPIKYGHVSVPYCSRSCRDSQMSMLVKR